MSRAAGRWSKRKIGLALAICVAAAVALFWLSQVVEPEQQQDSDLSGSQRALLTVPTFLMMMGTVASMLAALSVGWLVYRIKDDRTPAWEKKPRRRKRRRR